MTNNGSRPPTSRAAGFAPQETAISIVPSIMAGIVLLLALVLSIRVLFPALEVQNLYPLIFLGLAGSVYLAFSYFFYTRAFNRTWFAWINTALLLLLLLGLSRFTPAELDLYLFALMIVICTLSSIISDRLPAYFLAIGFFVLHGLVDVETIQTYDWVVRLTFTFTALMGAETVQQLKSLAVKQVSRLELINEFSRQVTSTLETDQVLHLLNATFQNTLEADTYFMGLVEGDQIVLRLFYDDGEYFNETRFDLKGSLSGWVVRNQKELFLPDMRQEVELDDVEISFIGKDKASLCWMGVPVRGSHVNGIMAIASYTPNSFTRSDLELLTTIAQRAAHALDNAHHHAQVEHQARLDSLTGVLNHGSFIAALEKLAGDVVSLNDSLALIMLDIDYFKRYNDTYGHQVGDEVLVNLCRIIREHIKSVDEIGRWGGEEFGIILVNTNAEQALKVAQRIQETLSGLQLNSIHFNEIPAPTISQGIAILPLETHDVQLLIDLADRRLFVAKDRGRDQIEFPLEI